MKTTFDSAAFAIPTLDDTPTTVPGTSTEAKPEAQGKGFDSTTHFTRGTTSNQPVTCEKNVQTKSKTNPLDDLVAFETNAIAVKDFKRTMNPEGLNNKQLAAQRQLADRFFSDEGFRQACMFEAGINDDLNNLPNNEAMLHERANNVSLDYIEVGENGSGTLYMSLPADTKPTPNSFKAGAAVMNNPDGELCVVASIECTPDIEAKAVAQGVATGIKYGCIWQGDNGLLGGFGKSVDDLSPIEMQRAAWQLQVIDAFGSPDLICALVKLGDGPDQGPVGINIVHNDEGYAPAGSTETYYEDKFRFARETPIQNLR